MSIAVAAVFFANNALW